MFDDAHPVRDAVIIPAFVGHLVGDGYVDANAARVRPCLTGRAKNFSQIVHVISPSRFIPRLRTQCKLSQIRKPEVIQVALCSLDTGVTEELLYRRQIGTVLQ